MKSRIGEAVDAAPALILTYKYRLNPEKRQHRALERILEQQRQLYNAALQERIEAYQKAGKTITEVDQSRSLTVIRADDPAFAGVQRRIQRETLRRLDRAYKAFFKRAKQGAGASSGFPKFKSFHTFDGFGFDAFQQIKFDGKALRFAGMPGALRVLVDRALPSHQIKNIWFKREGRRWFCGLQVEAPLQDHRRGCGQREVGADWGTSVLAALSTGEMIANPRPHEAALAALRRAQRKVARRKKGSHRRRKALEELSRLTAQVANRRRNTLDKVSKRLVTHFATVAIEDLTVASMMNAERPGEALPQFVKTRRNREALDAAPYRLRQMLTYKAQKFGARLLLVDAKNTTHDCFWCGRPHFKELTDAEHVCTTPGLFFGKRAPRKVNAARVILKRALSHRDTSRGGLAPGGAPQGANRTAGSGCLGNTASGQPHAGQRPRKRAPQPQNS